MNLPELFELQAALDTHIEHEHPRQPHENRLEQKVLALLVELGELAQNWRGFKFWSNDQQPRTKVECEQCNGCGGYYRTYENAIRKEKLVVCSMCDGTGYVKDRNPLLEEYVDCLHFILSIGNELEINEYYAEEVDFCIGYRAKRTEVIKNFIEVYNYALKILKYDGYLQTESYHQLLSSFAKLGDSLGFEEEQIEQAYIKKNEVNHQRQLSGY